MIMLSQSSGIALSELKSMGSEQYYNVVSGFSKYVEEENERIEKQNKK